MRPKAGAFSRYRPRILTLIVLIVVAAPIVVANLCHDEFTPQKWPPPNASFGWPFIWYGCEFPSVKAGGMPRSMNPELVWWSGPRLAGNLAIWFVMLAIAGIACEWLLRHHGPRLSYRLRLVTLIVLFVVAATIVLANLSVELSPGAIESPWNYPSHGWPLIWRWRIVGGGYNVVWVLDRNFSAVRLICNMAVWLVMLAVAGGACEWLLRRYRPRLQWSLQSMLAVVGLLAVFCAWCTALRDRANLQDPIISAFEDQGQEYYLEYCGPEWLGLVGADRFRRRIVGAALDYSRDDDEELLKRLGRLPSLRYLSLSVEQLTPGMAAALGGMPQLRILRIDDTVSTDDDVTSQECLAAIGKLAELEELRLEGMIKIVSGSLGCLDGLKNLKSLGLEVSGVQEWEIVAVAGVVEAELERLDRSHGLLLLADLPALPRLETIDLRYSRVDDHDLHFLTVLPRLKSLNLTDTFITDAGLLELASLESLEELAINNGMVSVAGLESLLALKHLKSLHLDRSYDNSNRLSVLLLDHGDELSALESEVDGLRRALEALRQSNMGIVIDGRVPKIGLVFAGRGRAGRMCRDMDVHSAMRKEPQWKSDCCPGWVVGGRKATRWGIEAIRRPLWMTYWPRESRQPDRVGTSGDRNCVTTRAVWRW